LFPLCDLSFGGAGDLRTPNAGAPFVLLVFDAGAPFVVFALIDNDAISLLMNLSILDFLYAALAIGLSPGLGSVGSLDTLPPILLFWKFGSFIDKGFRFFLRNELKSVM
jgi:hypothetical protein